jgi:hypothetical protein
MKEVPLSTAVAEAPVVEDERREARGCKPRGKRPEPIAPRSREAMSHGHDRHVPARVNRPVEPCSAGVAVNAECGLGSIHAPYSTGGEAKV